ncbi:DNA-binding transcriptional regulator, IclR family [Propionibacterium cyclohexanicum]|uniref:Glycerol operon regulatory protein n=1 Tax=Propionibacterium cyclohexanicum TaxID=64702 RepID=A0A1H9TF79_9ACTN|nr:IclR family transcriptional regulator [Propionibacterium cyclohexanicum]SER95852.1 DNA-binding transcriptional regulator, IclR family [Propionibacterium cyclohexanicum]
MTDALPRIESIDRALALLDALSHAGAEGTSLASLCAGTAMNKSTAYRALATLRARGYVRQDRVNGNYALGPAALMLARRYSSGDSLAASLHPALVALCRRADELVHLGVLNGDQIVYVDKVEPQHVIRVWSEVGRSVAAARTSLGLAILAYSGVERHQLSAYLHDPQVGAVITEEKLWAALDHARLHGYAYEIGQNEPGIACFGVPLLRAGTAVGALSVTTFAGALTASRRAELAALMKEVVPPLLTAGLSLPAALGG